MKTAITIAIFSFLFSGMLRAQEKTTLNVKDLNSGISKYIKKNYEGYKAVEAFRYDMIFEMKIQKAADLERLVFNREGKFLYKKTEADQAKVSLQTRSTISLKDVESDITRYIKKNYEGYKLTEAFKYDEVYTVKIVKGAENEKLLFDNEGRFVMKVAAPKPGEPTKKADSVPAKNEEHKKADTAKK